MSNQRLIEKIRKAREQVVKAGDWEFTIRRPTDLDYIGLRSEQGITQGEVMRRFVVGWNLLESDVVPGGNADTISFDQELFIEWVADHPECWGALTDAIIGAYNQHLEQIGEKLGEQKSG